MIVLETVAVSARPTRKTRLMPYPKGINTAEVRAAWMAERRETILAFDRLVDAGMPRYKAARALGKDVTSITAMRRSVEQLEAGGYAGREGNCHIDLGLALLACLRKPGETLTSHDIAAWCGCSHAAIQVIEKKALQKVRSRLVEGVVCEELAEELREMLARGSVTA